jgi:ribose-phosphate pyrophosphokinase
MSMQRASPTPVLVALRESDTLALEISHTVGIAKAPIEERSFEEGEFKLRPLTSVRDRTVFVVHSLAGSVDAPATQRLVRLLFLLFGLKDAGAARRIALLPYMPFARKDRRTQSRDPVNSRYVAQLLEATGVDRILTLDVHNPAALDNAFRIPVDHFSAIPLFVDHFAKHVAQERLLVASPDVGGIKRVQIFRECLERRLGREVELAFIEKRRAGGTVSSGGIVGTVTDREVIVLDDLCASGGTLIRAAAALRAAGARAVQVAFTHAPLASGLAALVAADTIDQIVVTDSVGSVSYLNPSSAHPKVHILKIAPLFAQAVARMLSGAPVAPLLEAWPPSDSA